MLKRKKSFTAIVITLLIITFQADQIASAAAPKLGAKCTKLNEVTLVKSEILMCMSATKGWTWQSMGSTTTTPTKVAQVLPLVLNMTRKEAAQVNSYIACLHTNGLVSIKTLSDIWNIDPKDSTSKTAIDACLTMRPLVADKPQNKYIPAQQSSTKREIRIVVIGKNPKVEIGKNYQCTTGLGNFSIRWGITNKPLYPSFVATTDGTPQSLAFFKATVLDASNMKLDALTDLAVGKYLTCIVADPSGSTYLGSASVLIPK